VVGGAEEKMTEKKYDKEYLCKGYKVKVRYNNTKSFDEFLTEYAESFVKKVIVYETRA
jgi:hypothetical protein